MAIKFANALKYLKTGSFGKIIQTDPNQDHIEFVIVNHNDIFNSNGIVKFRRDYRKNRVPSKVNYELRNVDIFGNPIFPFTGPTPVGFISAGLFTSPYFLKFGRSEYASAKFLDGRIVLFGGLSGSTLTPLSGAEYFSTASNTWSVLPDMSSNKIFAAATTIANGILVNGGTGSNSNEGLVSYVLSSSNLTFTPIRNSLISRKDHSIVTLSNNVVFAPGGTALISGTMPFTGSEFYDPSTNFWTGTLPIPLYPYDRIGYSLTLLNDNSVLLCGGRDPKTGIDYSHCFRFTPNTTTPNLSTWVTEASMSTPRAFHKSILLPNGNVLILGGETAGSGDNFQFGFPLSFGDFPNGTTSKAEIYDSTAHTLTPTSQMISSRSRFGVSLMTGDGVSGRIFIGGGISNNSRINNCEVYDITQNSFLAISPMSQSVSRIDSFTINNPSNLPNWLVLTPGGEQGNPLIPFTGSQLYTTKG